MKKELESTDQANLDLIDEVTKAGDAFTFDANAYKESNPDETKPTPETWKVPPVKGDDPDAPFGRNPDGSPVAPYGFTKRGNRVKTIQGRPRDDDKAPGGTVTPATGQSPVKQPASDDAGQLRDALKESEPKPAAPGETPQPSPAPVSAKPTYKVWINGSMFLVAMDFVFPGIIAYAHNYFNKDYKVNKKALKFDDDEKKELEPLADEVVKELLARMSPMEQFLVFTSILYGAKLAAADKHKVKVSKPKESDDEKK